MVALGDDELADASAFDLPPTFMPAPLDECNDMMVMIDDDDDDDDLYVSCENVYVFAHTECSFVWNDLRKL